MIQSLKLLLPALIPSWNFFDVIADSPRIEYALLPTPDESSATWQQFRPRPQHVSLTALLGRLFWNAHWNETLFVVSCAERLLENPTPHSITEIFHRIADDLDDQPEGTFLRFRISLLSEQDGVLTREIAYVSDARLLAEIDA